MNHRSISLWLAQRIVLTIVFASTTSISAASGQDRQIDSSSNATEDLIQGYFALGSSNPAKAIKLLESSIRKDPSVVQAYVGLGDALDGQNRHQQAFIQYKKAISIDKNYLRSYWQCARTLNRSKRFNEAVTYCDKGLAMNKPYTLLYMYRGDAYAGLKQDKKAIDDYTMVLKHSPSQFKALSRRGYLFFRLKKYPEALSDFNEYIRLRPKATDGYTLRRTVYLKMGKNDLAKKDEETLRRLDSTRQSVEDIFGQF